MTGKSAAREQRTKSLILSTLAKNKDGLTISDLSHILDLHYTTASKYLAVLEAAGIVKRRDIGMAKVFRIKENEK
ncbi:MAG: winged helix-turn-helix domain-containing protein [Candidatus Aenigmarchaeota archaeon]|nr:winged helix-turn-helix domain-containing protein [Candidatus Aenigmarchaeota archaeon]